MSSKETWKYITEIEFTVFFFFNERGRFTSDASQSSGTHVLVVKVRMSVANVDRSAPTSPLCINYANSKE